MPLLTVIAIFLLKSALRMMLMLGNHSISAIARQLGRAPRELVRHTVRR
ncbi:hypothetical protein [Vreelandella venusta]